MISFVYHKGSLVPKLLPCRKTGREPGRTDHVHPWRTMHVFMHVLIIELSQLQAHAVPACLRSQNKGSGEASFVDTNSTDSTDTRGTRDREKLPLLTPTALTPSRGGVGVWGYHKGSQNQVQDEVCSKIFRPTFFSTLVKLQLQTGN